jgi:hypothetical protein
MANKKFSVEIEMDTIEFIVSAKNQREAKAKALVRLRNTNPALHIKKSWPDNKKQIHVSE